ncbi:MAG: hypothetical protein JSV95_08280 [Gemmatimonadota bacterium]|jgi:hypothetical protein|nr:MAG: hypothetical protein JSV95_08280 [Gemmatimonadota bacterium]
MAGFRYWQIRTLLEVLVQSMGARRAVVWRRDGGGGDWVVEDEVTAGGPSQSRSLAPEGHPFTWAAREDLVLQVLSKELFKGAPEGEWSLVAPVSEWGRLLCISFAGSPGVNARSAVESAVRHLRAIAPWEGLH